MTDEIHEIEDVDIKDLWKTIHDAIYTKPIEEMSQLELVQKFGVFQFLIHKANKEAEKLQEESLKLSDFKAQLKK